MNYYLIGLIWAILTSLSIFWIYKRNKPRVYFYGGLLLLTIGFTSVYLAYGIFIDTPNKYQDLAAQLQIMASAVLGSNFITHSITMARNP